MYSSTCFERPHVHHQELNKCSSSLWFYSRNVVVAVLLVVVGPISPTTTNSTATNTRLWVLLFAIYKEKRRLVTDNRGYEVNVMNEYYRTGYEGGDLMQLNKDTVGGLVFVNTVMNCRVVLNKEFLQQESWYRSEDVFWLKQLVVKSETHCFNLTCQYLVTFCSMLQNVRK
jgi:hypothetical protein